MTSPINGAIHSADIDPTRTAHEAWQGMPEWRVRRLRGGQFSSAELDAMSGPRIALVVGAACLVLNLSIIWRGDPSETAAGFWPAAGAALVAMLALSPRRWGWVVAGILVPTVIGLATSTMPVTAGLWWAAGNISGPAAAALALRKFQSSRWQKRGRVTVSFLLMGAGVGPMLGAAIGSIGTVVEYHRPWASVWIEWTLGDGLGVLAVVPLLMTCSGRTLVRRTSGELVALAALVAVAAGLAFVDIGTNGAALLPYLILIVLIWAGMRFGSRAAAAAGLLVGIAANIAASTGLGPFGAGHGSVNVVTLQVFLAIALITSFVVATMASELAGHDEVQRLLTRQANFDALTGLPNRLLFTEGLNKALRDRERTGTSVGVLLIDLDDFKAINDRHGHPTGDRALTVVAQVLRRCVRPQDLLARIGGDEFVVVCEGLTDGDEARAIADTVSRALSPLIEIGGLQHRLSGSIGVALARPTEPITTTDLLRRADIALYHSKQTDGIKISLFDIALESVTRRRAELEQELRGAIERREMSVAYQPIIRLSTGRVAKFEALARWDNRRFGSVGPDEFIAVAEDTGLIGAIGDWVLETACRQVAAWREQYDDIDRSAASVAVNVSARQLGDAGFPARVTEVLDDLMLEPRALIIEITETAVMADFDASVNLLAELRDLGVRLSMDDFGTGYSSLTYLRRIPVDTLKIDRSFVMGLGGVPEDAAIVQSIVNLGHSFGIEVVAEGVESMGQLDHLMGFGCDYGQGFLWSEAVDGAAAGALLKDTVAEPAAPPAIIRGGVAPI